MLVLSVDDPREAVDGHLESNPVLQPCSSSISSLQLEVFPLRLPFVLCALAWEWPKQREKAENREIRKGLKEGA